MRQIEGEREIADAAAGGPVLVICGPGERRRLEAAPGLALTPLAEGPRSTAMLLVRRR